MDIQTKYRLIEKIMQIEDNIILNHVKQILYQEEKEMWNDLPDDVKTSVNRGLEQSEKGEGRPSKQIMQEFRKRYQG